MSDLGDLNLPSYPTFPATTSSDLSSDDGNSSPLVPMSGNSMESPGSSGVTIDKMDSPSNAMNSSLTSNESLSYYGLSSPMQSDVAAKPSLYTQPVTVGTSSNYNTQTPSIRSFVSAPYQAPGNGFSTLGQMGTLPTASLMDTPGVASSSNISQVTSNPFSSMGSNVRPEPWQSVRQQQSASPHFSASRLATAEPKTVDGCSESGSGAAQVSDATVALRIQALEQLCATLSKERGKMEEMFGRQRKTFMNQMSLTEKQLSTCKARIDSYEREVRSLREEIEDMEKQLTESAIRAAGIRESFDADRVKYEEEIASLKAIVTVQTQDTNQAVQQERNRWKAERMKLMTELEDYRRAVPVPVPVPGRGHPNSSNMSSSPPDRLHKSPSPGSEDENLELSMIKAKEDASLLRSVVVPLEEEIKSLRKKLQASDSKVEELEGTVKSLKEAEEASSTSQVVPIIDLETSLNASESNSRDFNSPIPTDTKELQQQLKLARSACSDLEMHTSQMNLQKNIMQEEIRSLNSQLKLVKSDYFGEKAKVVELKKTWELANDHFIVSQDKLKREIYRLQQKLERGAAASPLRDLDIKDLPAPDLEKAALEGKDKTTSRRHQRSLSSEEASEALLDTIAAQQTESSKSASWSSLCNSSSLADSAGQMQSLEAALEKSRGEARQLAEQVRSLEQQVARVQTQMAEDIREKEDVIDKLKSENTKLRASVMRQKQQHESLRRLMDDLKDEMRAKIETFQGNEKEFKSSMKVVRDKFVELKQDTQKEIAKMNEGRRDVFLQLKTSKEEYECLKRVQHDDMIKYQAEIASLKQSLEEASTSVDSTSQQYLMTKEQLQHVRDMMLAERGNKEKLSVKLEEAEKKISVLGSLEAMVETEKKAKEEALAAKVNVEKKAREFVNDQKCTIEQLNKEKSAAEGQVKDLLRQVASLKHKLNHTEETQKDFVKLSQSLQMQLASIEEERQRNQESLQQSPSSLHDV